VSPEAHSIWAGGPASEELISTAGSASMRATPSTSALARPWARAD
jgi:hypothetical protein